MASVSDEGVDDTLSSNYTDFSTSEKMELCESPNEGRKRVLERSLKDTNSAHFMNIDVRCSPESGKNDDQHKIRFNSHFRLSCSARRDIVEKVKLGNVSENTNGTVGDSRPVAQYSPFNSHNSSDSDEILCEEIVSDSNVNHCVQGSSNSEKSFENKLPNTVTEYVYQMKDQQDDHGGDSPILSNSKLCKKLNVGACKLSNGKSRNEVGGSVNEVSAHVNVQNEVPLTPTRNSRLSGLRNGIMGSPAHQVRNMTGRFVPVGRRLDFDGPSNSSTPKPLSGLHRMNKSTPGPVTHSTPADLFRPRRCMSEAVTRVDKSRLHLWVNPFSPAGSCIISDIRNAQDKGELKKRNVGSRMDENEFISSPKKRKRALSSRYETDFVELEELGMGEHGCVYKCLNLLTGLIYAVKISKNQLKPGHSMRTARDELYAHGVLEHKNLVRNYSSWLEDNYVYIQNEYCNRGNLESYMKTHRVDGNKAKKLLYDIASALRFMHGLQLVHLDVKPGNIFVHETQIVANNDGSDSDSDDESEFVHVIFKLGDFGHIKHLDNLTNVEEGDCRYMARELLNDVKKPDVTKADIFSLGLSVYEAAGGGDGAELPKNGDDWHALRDGQLKKLPSLSDEMNLLLKRMVDPVVMNRPSAAEICKILAPNKVKEKLKEEIKSKTQKIAVLEAKQRERNCYIKQLKAQSLKFIQAADDIHAPRCAEKLPGKKK